MLLKPEDSLYIHFNSFCLQSLHLAFSLFIFNRMRLQSTEAQKLSPYDQPRSYHFYNDFSGPENNQIMCLLRFVGGHIMKSRQGQFIQFSTFFKFCRIIGAHPAQLLRLPVIYVANRGQGSHSGLVHPVPLSLYAGRWAA